MKRKSKVLITGSSGFVGSSIIKTLNKSFNFIGLDKLSGQFTTEILDLRNYIELSVLDKYKFDYVVCTAWDQISNNIYENNIKSTNNLIKYFSNINLKGIIFISSIYVSTSVDIQYSRSKIDSENIIFDSSIPFIIIRPDMIYSINENKIQEQLSYMKKGFAICIGHGRSLRTPTHILDLIKLVKLILEQCKFTNRVYEIGSPKSYTQKDILRILSSFSSLSPYVIHIPTFIAKILFKLSKKIDAEQADAINYDRIADLNRLIKDFNIIPIDFETGIKISME
jgi:nucleoside-diphosphate-sugar epimerase